MTLNALGQLPVGATACGSERQSHLRALRYLDTFSTNRELLFEERCKPGDYVVRSRYVFEKAPSSTPDINDSLRIVQAPDNAAWSEVTKSGTYTIERVS